MGSSPERPQPIPAAARADAATPAAGCTVATDAERTGVANLSGTDKTTARGPLPGSEHVGRLAGTVAAQPAAAGVARILPVLGPAVFRPTAGIAAGRGLAGRGASAVAAMASRMNDGDDRQAGCQGDDEADDMACHASGIGRARRGFAR